MFAGTAGWVGEEGSGKQLSDSEPRVRTLVVLGGQGSQGGLPLLLNDLGQMPASFWASVYPSLEGHWLPSSLRPYLPLIHIKSHRRGKPKAGLQSPESYLLFVSESHYHPTLTRPGLPLPSFYNLPSPSSSSVEQDKVERYRGLPGTAYRLQRSFTSKISLDPPDTPGK